MTEAYLKKEKMLNETYDDTYYHFKKDYETYLDPGLTNPADMLFAYSSRGRGKTYSALRYFYPRKIKFIFLRNTEKDVAVLCSDSSLFKKKHKTEDEEETNIEQFDPSPFKPLNRDFPDECNVKARMLDANIGMAEFVDMETKKQVGLILNLKSLGKIRGMDFSEYDVIIFDECITNETPTAGFYLRGEHLLNFCDTVARDRFKRGGYLKIILFSNCETYSHPITSALNIIDPMTILANTPGKSHEVLKDGGLVLHHIKNDECPFSEEELNTSFRRILKDTDFYAKNYEGNFVIDLSNIGTSTLKNYKCACAFSYKSKQYFVYFYEHNMYITKTPSTHYKRAYDLSKDFNVKAFYKDIVVTVYMLSGYQDAKITFDSYEIYDLFKHYTKYLDVKF